MGITLLAKSRRSLSLQSARRFTWAATRNSVGNSTPHREQVPTPSAPNRCCRRKRCSVRTNTSRFASSSPSEVGAVSMRAYSAAWPSKPLSRRKLEAEGWSVKPVEQEGRGYDLYCRRDRTELHAEVKGRS